ncbi:PREDICTED: uncharacterized protein LOC108365264 [Rhagoletis zephyria]|uniref:uncharacterized protein LOC108365263 n=1 Tax=Rhagoletis zephyria TaxID=28612 RepID=UPI00081196F3|nr:PREDICTED: uncharacterized protein LOC108365263 [Rhagoletis zephyria]XP_017474749.1 PREDICTED: uncharacterized protein LOC108365264 [Rhagoletis zephyria]
MVDVLTVDCLLEVFKYLSLNDQVAATAVNKCFRNIIVDRIWRLKYKTIVLKDAGVGDLTMEERSLFNSLIAPHAIKIIVHERHLLPSSSAGKWRDIIYAPILKLEYPQLREIRFYDTCFDKDDLTVILNKCPHLEVLLLKDQYPTDQHLAKIPHLRELVLVLHSLYSEPLKNCFKNIAISRLCLDDRYRPSNMKSNQPLLAPFKILYCVRKEILNITNLRGQGSQLYEFFNSLQTLKELFVNAKVMPIILFSLIEGNLQLEHLYIKIGYEFQGFGEWICNLSDRLHEQQRNQIITVHVGWQELPVQLMQQALELYDHCRGYRRPAIRIQKRATSDQAEYMVSLEALVQLVNILMD